MEITRTQSKKPWTVLAILALIGVGLSIQLTSHYYDVRSGMADFKSFCNISQKMNCDAVAASPYAEFAGGFPLSSFSAGWYLALFVVALIGRNRFWRREAARFAFLMTAFGFVLSAGYLVIMAFRLKTFCLFCLFVDGVGLLSLLTVLWLKPEPLSAAPAESAKWKRLAGTLAACLVASVLSLKLMDNVSISASEMDEHVNAVLSSPVLPIETAGYPSFGPANAPVTIVEFSDFQCPYCRIGAMTMNTLLERYPTQVRLIFKPFPLDAACNRIVTQPMHLTACEAARTALCAGRQNGFEAVYETLFDHQQQIVPGAPTKMAAQVGLDPAKIDECAKDPAISQTIARSIEEGIQLGVQGTPTFFVNGHKLESFYPGPFWDKLVEKILAH